MCPPSVQHLLEGHIMHHSFSGKFKILATKPSGDERVVADWFSNLITDSGLDRLGTAGGSAIWNFCRVGLGSAAPAFTDTALSSQVASSNSVIQQQSGIDLAGGYGWRRITWQFTQGTVVGNLAEIATAWTASSAGIFSRALIKDSFGNPTTISILADETLRVVWEVRIYWPVEDTLGAVVFTGNIGGTYNFTGRASEVSAASTRWIPSDANSGGGIIPVKEGGFVNTGSALGPIDGVPTYFSRLAMDGLTVTNDSYVPGSFRASLLLTLGLANANFAGGIDSVTYRSLYHGNSYQMAFSPAIIKTASQIVQLRLAISWGRA